MEKPLAKIEPATKLKSKVWTVLAVLGAIAVFIGFICMVVLARSGKSWYEHREYRSFCIHCGDELIERHFSAFFAFASSSSQIQSTAISGVLKKPFVCLHDFTSAASYQVKITGLITYEKVRLKHKNCADVFLHPVLIEALRQMGQRDKAQSRAVWTMLSRDMFANDVESAIRAYLTTYDTNGLVKFLQEWPAPVSIP